MIYDRYYYSKLSSEGKIAYKELYYGILNHESQVTVQRVSDITPDTLLRYIGFDNPHIFYVDFGRTEGFYDEYSISYSIRYWYSEKEAKDINKKINTTLQKMLSNVIGTTDYEKELFIHDLLVKNVCYDASPLKEVEGCLPQTNSIVGVLFHKASACEGIAKVTKMLLNMVNIKCIVAYGEDLQENVPHAWNIVKIERNPYHLDVTWDINVSRKGLIRYDYFNLPDVAIRMGHKFSEAYPDCTSKKHNYYYKNGLVASNIADVDRIVESALCRGKKCFAFRYRGSEKVEYITEHVCRTVSMQSSGSGNYHISFTINTDQNVVGVIIQ